MTDVTYNDIYGRVKALSGIDSPSSTVQTALVSLVNRRANMAYKATDFWPRYLVGSEQRNTTVSIVGPTQLVIGYTYTIVTVGDTNWVALGAASNTVGTVFNAIATGTGSGTASLTSNTIPYTQAGLNTIDTFLRIFKVYPPFYQYSSIELEFYVDGSGAHIVNDTTSTQTNYVSYKKVWEGPYTTASTNIPEEWYDYISQGVYADYLRMDGKPPEFVAAEGAMANDILEQRLSRADITRAAGTIAHRISTHLNRAFRRS